MTITAESNGHTTNGVHGFDGYHNTNGLNGHHVTNGYHAVNGFNGSNGNDTRLIDDLSRNDSTTRDNGLSDYGLASVPTITSNGLHEDNSSKSSPWTEPIAIVGMGMRLPGGVNNGDDFWKLLVEKREGRIRVPEDRYNIDAFYNAHGKPGTVKTQYGHFLQQNLKHLDSSFFSMTRAETEKLDPQARLLLEVTREAFENAGEVDWRGKDIACFVGVFGEDWQDIHQKDSQDAGMYRVTGYGDFLLGNRISYEYNLKGPSMTVKTGCSSSLICLHMACQALLNDKCTAAVVAGTNLIMSPTMTVAMSEQGVLSSDARCKTFDKTADGYARGEAVNVLYVKKLSDAVRDGNPIQAVIRATASNCDGKTPGISHPSSESHEALLRSAHDFAGLKDFSQTAFIECHGTGTAIGDPLETRAVANVFGGSGIYIGSHKPNVGHSEGASGVTGVIKTVLALQRRTIPPNINFSVGNSKIPFENLTVPLEPVSWPADRAERACVNSFGLGGANATALIDSAASFGYGAMPAAGRNDHSDVSEGATKPSLLVFSANHTDSLTRIVNQYSQYLEKKPGSLSNLAYTLGARREHLPFRTFRVTDSTSILDGSPAVKPTEIPEVSFIFTGQGAQWFGMAKELITSYPSFMKDIIAMDEVLKGLPQPPSWSILLELLGAGQYGKAAATDPKLSARFGRAEFAQPLCTAIQIAIVNLLRSWGIIHKAVLGHSSGEIGAAYTTGALTLPEAITIAYYRGLVTKQQKRAGGMAAIGLGKAEVTPFLLPGTVVACENSPTSVTLSGDLDQLRIVMETIQKDLPGTFVRGLMVEMAYHSYHMREIGQEYQRLLEGHVSADNPKCKFYSSVSSSLITKGSDLGPAYWRKNLESCVLFSTATQAMIADAPKDRIFLEIGPHAALQGPLRQIFKSADAKNATYISALKRNTDSTESLLTAVGQLFLKGVDIDFSAMSPGRVLTDVPTYPWNHDAEYWDESRVSSAWRLRKFPHHDILGNRITENSDLEPAWRNMIRLDDVAWIRDHQVSTDTIFPGAGYIAMAGEAIRQLSDRSDYTVRHVSIASAMVMHETHPTEVVTSLRPVRLTTSLESVWFEFTITSHNGTTWTKHCSGEVRSGSEHEPKSSEISHLPRKVDTARWYQSLKKVGLCYSGRFQGMTSISAATNTNTAAASMSNHIEDKESSYQLHPSTIDLCIQLFAAAAARGLPRNLKQLCVPTYIEHLYISKPKSEMRALANAAVNPKGVITGDGFAVADGQVVMEMRGLSLFPLDDDVDARGTDPHAAASIHWKPDLDFLDVKDLIKPSEGNQRDYYWAVEKLSVLCTIESYHRLASLKPGVEYLGRYQSWLAERAHRAADSDLQLVPEAESFTKLSSEGRCKLIDSLAKQIEATPTRAAAIAISRIFNNCQDILEGNKSSLQLLLQDDILTQIYNMGDRWSFGPFFSALSHSKPWLRILEIGAGTGGTTATVLPHLISAQGERMYGLYHYTDISSGFFSQAKERFSNYQKIEYSTLDVTKDPVDQDFEEGSYDIIIATNVLHATPELNVALKNVRKLLRPDGHLFLDELCSEAKWINYIMGTFSGWWLGEADNRAIEPYVSPDRWTEELLKQGFNRPTVVYDDELPYQSNSLIVTTPSVTVPSSGKRVTLLCDSKENSLVRDIEAAFSAVQVSVDICNIQEQPPAQQDIISLLDVDSPFFTDISEEKYNQFLSFIQSLDFSAMLWLTRASQVNATNPKFAQSLGVMRAIRNELAIDLATLELDECNDGAVNTIVQVFAKLQRRDKSGEYEPDFEYVLDNKVVSIPRFHWFSIRNELSKNTQTQSQGPKRLEIGKRGFLKTLGWVRQPVREFTADEVEVEVKAVGMNFKDVLIAMGVVDGHESESNGLGCECSGVVRRIGPDVKNIAAGDRVVVFSGGSYATTLVTNSQLVAKMPDNLSFEDGATMPCVYSTVIHSLLHLGRLSKHDTVLIQSACGGIGISAIQIAKMVGATIYATVGTEEKVQYLVDTFAIPRENIFNSRNSSFLADVLRATKGKGVDVVLNSLSGELLHASWQCVAKYGKMIEIGKRDFIGRAKLNMEVFESNRAFFGVDFAQICAERPDITKSVLNECMGYYAKGAIGPVGPITRFEAFHIEDAFRFMQKGSHIGKIVVKMPHDPEALPQIEVAQSLTFRADVSYLLVGGLGGLGKAISTWMVDNGARSLVFLSRSAGQTESDIAFFDELATQGCSATAVPGSVTNFADVNRAITNAPSPVAGILQMSMVLRDGPLPEMSYNDWQTAIEPKVHGTWNLHEATSTIPLDFLVCFSSSSGLVGQRGQANYASANTFLDAFVQYRHANGLPGSVLDIGPVEEIGYLSTNKVVLEQFRSTSLHTLQEQDVLDSLNMIIGRSKPVIAQESGGYTNPSQVGIGLRMTMPSSAPNNRCIWKRDRRMSVYRNIEQFNDSSDSTIDNGLRQFLASAESDPSTLREVSAVEFLATEMGTTLYGFLLLPTEGLDVTAPIASLGIDSLVAIELRNWCRHKLGVEVTVLEILDFKNLEAFGEAVAHKLYAKYGGSEDHVRESFLQMKAP